MSNDVTSTNVQDALSHVEFRRRVVEMERASGYTPLLLSHLSREQLEAKCCHVEWERDYWYAELQKVSNQDTERDK